MVRAATDVDDNALRRKPDKPTNVRFLPHHTLEGFDFTGHSWGDIGLIDQLNLTKLEIGLENGFDGVTWTELGQKQTMIEVLEGWDMYIRYTGLHAFDISRGEW